MDPTWFNPDTEILLNLDPEWVCIHNVFASDPVWFQIRIRIPDSI
jgi:hypothetical protein